MSTTIVLVLCLIALIITACQPAAPNALPPDPPGGALNTTADRRIIETDMNGIRIGLGVPPGWAGDTVDGLVIAEHFGSMDGGIPTPGMLVYVFVPPLDRFEVPEPTATNVAQHVLTQVVQMPTEIGVDVTASSPSPFRWAQHDAAYYLLNSSDGAKTLVLALEVVENGQLVVVNLSAPAAQVNRIRAMLPFIMDGLTVNGERLLGSDLDVLPDPLVFPARNDDAASLPRPAVAELVTPIAPLYFFSPQPEATTQP